MQIKCILTIINSLFREGHMHDLWSHYIQYHVAVTITLRKKGRQLKISNSTVSSAGHLRDKSYIHFVKLSTTNTTIQCSALRDTEKHSFTLSFNALGFVLVRNQCSVLYSVKCTLWQADRAMLPAGRAGTSRSFSGRVNVSEFLPVNVWPLIWVGYQWWAAMVKYGQVSSMVVPLKYKQNQCI